ncbi:hypothetical protein [Nitratiruptor tergarcus]|uniref:DUF4412 domain-containing protein n=1 Tax=Nitratiruptor tergarcus DSM 16512 TaxID=1069081 RepID=A0A1W1WSI2_9BACT|nr:hypothetical protein [Nitratiruptor tergarcus]SMC09257.1 hypothetical protein SAMN05660197_1063 [Nitratiruptor tergarcus DSM 16512]
MKKLLILLFTALALFASPYTGFMKLKKGDWAKYIIYTDEGTFSMTTKFLGTTEYKGLKVNIVEIESNGMVTQYWSAVGNDRAIQKLITKTPQGIMCMSEEMIGMMNADKNAGYHTTTPKEYNPNKPHIKFATYTLPNGKKIKVAIFKNKKSEVWVSSQVPFGIVLAKENGKTVMKLEDFGSGAKPTIPLKEARSCTPMALPFPTM